MNVSLPDELAGFVEAKVASGTYGSASEVVREALRLLKERDALEAEKLEWLRQAVREGIESGDAGEVDFEEIKREGRRRLGIVG